LSQPRRVLLLRHGRTEWNASGRFQGQQDSALDVIGRAQAKGAAVAVAPMQPDALLTSDLSRAADTAALVGDEAGLTPVFDERLREIHLGRWEGLTRAEARSRFPEEYASWQAGVDARRGDGETYAEVGARAVSCVLEWLDRLGAGSLLVAAEGAQRRPAAGGGDWRRRPLRVVCVAGRDHWPRFRVDSAALSGLWRSW
jgi:glucosyl-3-phosphoglycerate phosphatase